MVQKALALTGSAARPVGVVLVPAVVCFVFGDWPEAGLMAILLAVSSRLAAVGHVGMLLVWLAFWVPAGPRPAFPDEWGLSAHAAGTALLPVCLLLLGKPLVLSSGGDAPKWVVRFAPAIRVILAALAFGFLAAGLFRSLPVRYAGYGAAAACYAWRFRGTRAPEGGAHRRWAGNAAATAFSAALVVLLVEGGARLFLPPPPQSAGKLRPHDEALYTLLPGSTVHTPHKRNDGGTFIVRYDVSSQGIRDREFAPKTPGLYRIVMLGDSYTHGHALALEQTIPRRLEGFLRERMPGVPLEVANCGVGAYAPWQERIFLRERGFPLDPDLVILQLFPPNDVAGSYSQVGGHLQAIDTLWEKGLLHYRRQNEFPFRVERWLKSSSNAYALFVAGAGLDAPVGRLLADCRVFPPDRQPDIVAQTTRSAYQEVCLVDWYPELQEAWNLFAGSITGVRDDCAGRGVAFAAYVHGELISLQPDAWKELNARFPETPYEMNKDIRLTNEVLDGLGVPHPDVLEALRAHPNPQELYFADNGHFTPLGAQIVAECLAQFVRDTFLTEP
ncbi:MAG TPA: hypothetical protein PKL54_09820 [Candidatus Hydrogenedentes bacterium]|nr:hypothetical protein [Candidatus Hydrogenedentota bacterium]